MGNGLDTHLQVVADARRRQIIDHLRQQTDGTITFDALVDQLSPAPTSDQQRDRERLAIELHHTHLPKLTEHGIVEYDSASGTIRYQGDERVETILDALSEGIASRC